MAATIINRETKTASELRTSLTDKAFYWVKRNPDDNWEIGKWDESMDRFRFTNNTYQKLIDVHEVDGKPVTRKK